jgi:hypothetical protein
MKALLSIRQVCAESGCHGTGSHLKLMFQRRSEEGKRASFCNGFDAHYTYGESPFLKRGPCNFDTAQGAEKRP